MKQTTKAIVQAALAADDSIRCECAEAALRLLASNKAEAAPADVGQVLKASDVAKRLCVTTRTVRDFARRGLLRPVFGGGRKRLGFLAEDVRAFLATRGPASAASATATPPAAM